MMIAFLITFIFLLFIWLVFFKFKWLKFTKTWGIVSAFFAVHIFLIFVIGLRFVTPYSTNAKVVQYTIQLIPRLPEPTLVTAVLVQPDVPVKKGQPLFQFDRRPYEYQVSQLEAQLEVASATAVSAKYKVEQSKAGLAAAKQDVRMYKADLEAAEQKVVRSKSELEYAKRLQTRGRPISLQPIHKPSFPRGNAGDLERARLVAHMLRLIPSLLAALLQLTVVQLSTVGNAAELNLCQRA